MAISAPGIGSGLDINGIVSQLVALERQPITALQKAASTIQTQISAYGKVQSLLATLRDAAAALTRPTLWRQTTASSSDPSTLTASSSGGTAAAGSYGVQVDQLARSHSLASAAFAPDATVVGAGRLSIEVGRWAGEPPASFTPKAGSTTIDIDFTDPGTTLEQVRDAINASGAGVSAAIVRDVNGARLTLTARDSGTDSALRITASDGGDPPTALGGGLAAFTYAPDAGAAAMTQTQAPANALATINGLAIESSGNQLSGVLDGVSVTLLRPSTTAVAVNVVNDVEAQRKAVDDFVAAYNALNSFLGEQTRYDESTRTGAPLQGDSTAVGLRNRLRGLLGETGGASAVFARLGDIGLEFQRDGSIKADPKRLDEALANPGELGKLLGNVDPENPTQRGLAVRLRELADQLVDVEGPLTSRTEGLQGRLKRNRTDQERVEERVERVRARLLRQYQALDVRLGQLSGLSSYVGQQMTLLNSQFTSGKS